MQGMKKQVKCREEAARQIESVGTKWQMTEFQQINGKSVGVTAID